MLGRFDYAQDAVAADEMMTDIGRNVLLSLASAA